MAKGEVDSSEQMRYFLWEMPLETREINIHVQTPILNMSEDKYFQDQHKTKLTVQLGSTS